MLSQKDQKKIRSKLKNIYSQDIFQFNIDFSLREIVEIINKFNKKKNKKKKNNFRKNFSGYMLWR